MKIDGLQGPQRKRVELKEFFGGQDVWVEIRIYHPYVAAQLREESMKGMRFDSLEANSGDSKSAHVKATPVSEGMADRETALRELKLKNGVAEHNITSSGNAVVWEKSCWDALDDASPKILGKVLDALDALNASDDDDEGEADPT